MSHKCSRPSSANAGVFNKKSKVTCNGCSSLNRSTADSKDLSHHNETHGLRKVKQLKTRKERSQIRAASKLTSKINSHHQLCHGHCSKDTAHIHNCCHCSSVRNPQFPSVVPAGQERSIITDSRLISHHGLFSREVKSFDIERLLSEQKKHEQDGQHVKEKKNAATHLPSTEVSCSTAGLVTGNVDIVLKKADALKKTHDDAHQKRKKNPEFSDEGSDITSGQRPQRQLDLSPGSLKSLKHGSISPVTTTAKKSYDVMSEKDKKLNFTPIGDRHSVKRSSKKPKKCIVSTLEQFLNSPEVSAPHTQLSAMSPSPVYLSSSTTADNFDNQSRQKDRKYVSESVDTVAARLCDSLQFPFLRIKNLVSESREVLLKCLHEKHGPWLQDNLLELQTCVKFDEVSTKTVQDADHGFTVTKDEDLLSADAFLKRTKSRHSNWKSSEQLFQTPEQLKTAAWLPCPKEPSVSGLEDLVGPSVSSQFNMDFKPSKSLASDLFTTSPMLCHDEKASSSQLWRDTLFRSESKESHVLDSFESSFMEHTNAITEQSYGSQYCDNKMQPPFNYLAKLPDRYLTDEMHFHQHQDPFKANMQPFAPFVSSPKYCALQSSHFPDFNKFSDHNYLTGSSHSNNYTDMTHFPPFHILERRSQTPGSSFPSPERWSFPAMRLY